MKGLIGFILFAGNSMAWGIGGFALAKALQLSGDAQGGLLMGGTMLGAAVVVVVDLRGYMEGIAHGSARWRRW